VLQSIAHHQSNATEADDLARVNNDPMDIDASTTIASLDGQDQHSEAVC
jgi:hypothetical protein